MKIKSKKTALMLTAIIAISLLSTTFFITPSSAGSRTTTITDTYVSFATRCETQRKVFQNPRGQKYYYALLAKYEKYKISLRLYKSPDGEDWSNYSVIHDFYPPNFESADLAFFENDTELVVYIVWTRLNGTAYYCVVLIDDTTADTSVGTPYKIDFGDSHPRRYFNIEVDRNYYVWLAYFDDDDYYGDVKCVASNETRPGLENPYKIYWSNEYSLFGSGLLLYPGYPTIVALSGDGHESVLIIYNIDFTEFGWGYLMYAHETSWDGSTFTDGREGDLWNLGYCSPELSAVRRSDNYVDVIFLNGSDRITHRVWNVTTGWTSSCNTLYSGSSVASLALSIDRTSNPDKLYAFYIRQTGKINYKTSPVDSISWSSEQEIFDGTDSLDYLSSSYEDSNGRIQIIYTAQVSPYNVRFAEIGLMPVTVADSTTAYSTEYETQRKVFRNPRGKKNYYVLAANGSALNLWNSSNGISWSLAENISHPSFSDYESADLTFYENASGSKLVVYFVYSDINGKVYYRRGEIPDNNASITLDSAQEVFSSGHHRPIIKIANDGYVWIFSENHTTLTPGDYLLYKVNCTASTATYPGASPTWSSEHQIFASLESDIYFTAAPLSSSHDFLVVGQTYVFDYAPVLKGKELSWNGAAFSEGKVQDVDLSGWPGGSADKSWLSAVVDSSNVGHVLYCVSSSGSIQHRKWTVGSGWSGSTSVSGPIYSLSLSIDLTSSPNKLYAFYIRQTGKINYKTSAVGSISWSSEQEIVDGTESIDYLSSSYRDYNRRVQIIYTNQTSPYKIRFAITP